MTKVVVQSVRAFASHAEGWVFESKPRQLYLQMCVTRLQR